MCSEEMCDDITEIFIYCMLILSEAKLVQQNTRLTDAQINKWTDSAAAINYL